MSLNLLSDSVAGSRAPQVPGGLVPYSTTATGPSPAPLVGAFFDSDIARLKRMKHHVRTAARLIHETLGRARSSFHMAFITLTYKGGTDWEPEHISKFIKAAREWARRAGFGLRYCWVAELQKRGAVHYHCVFWIPRRVKFPKPDRRGWWPHGYSNTKGVKKSATGYLMKYVSKGDMGNFPKGCRVCASGGLDKPAADEFHYWRLPRYVRESIALGDRCKRCPGGGWLSRATGEIFRTDWRLMGLARVKRGKGRKSWAVTSVWLSDDPLPEFDQATLDASMEAGERAMARIRERIGEIEREESYYAKIAWLDLVRLYPEEV